MSKNKIKINGREQDIQCGLINGESLYSQLNMSCDGERLFLDVQSEVDIPINKDDYIVILGKESFVTGKSKIDDNPALKKQISIKVDDNPIELSKPKITGKEIKDSCKDSLPNSNLYIDLLNIPDQLIKDDFMLIINPDPKSPEHCFIIVPVSDDNIIDTEECAKHNKKPPKKQDKYKIKIDGQKYIAPAWQLSGKEILKLANKEWQQFSLQQKFKGGERKVIGPESKVDFSTPGVERFETVPKEAQQG